MNITVLGTGYVGLVTGTCLADLGHDVTCVDIDPERIQRLHAGEMPIYEPGLDDVVARNVEAERLAFANDDASVPGADVIFIAVGTPQGPDGAANLSFLEAAVDGLAATAARDAIVVIRSTVPPGTGDRMQARLEAAGSTATVVNAPEFLAEGTALKDFMQPDRLVFGGPEEATRIVSNLFVGLPMEAPRIRTDRCTAELAKYASNTFLAARVSLINEMANLCDTVGGDVSTLAHIVGLDNRIGSKFLRAGIGYGGSCFPKDVQALAAVARQHGVDVPVAQAAEVTNQSQWRRAVAKLETGLGGLAGKRIAVWGIAFKPGTDDLREAPGIKIMQALVDAGATVVAHDPVAKIPEGLVTQVDDALACLNGAHALLHATEWPEYAAIDPALVKQAMAGDLVVDGRNTLDAASYAAAGMRFVSMGARVPVTEVA
ncbi:MAG: UDP-glucose dehydrogenase family protein [Thermoplasmatota archaeon]